MEARVTAQQSGSMEVPLLEWLEVTMELDAKVEDPEEGNGSNSALALDAPLLSGELHDLLGGQVAAEFLLAFPSRSGVGRTGCGEYLSSP